MLVVNIYSNKFFLKVRIALRASLIAINLTYFYLLFFDLIHLISLSAKI